ncbi:MAG: DUF1707 domain-containing protein [Deltaproteobacteria bacterium]|jgi:hypothetical protein|nr:DUF1707 domain-containing protein [Deltaproteobacteria bacterium]
MSGESRPVDLGPARERAIAVLTEAFTNDHLELDAFEERLSKVHNAESEAEISALYEGLAPATHALAARPAVLPAAPSAPPQRLMAILGSTEKRGSWSGAAKMQAKAIFGSVELDFREARLPAGVVELEVDAIFGSIEIVVPPELAVEVHGLGILGSFESLDRAPNNADPGRPLLRVTGKAIMGSVEIKTRLVGETGLEAWARSREEHRALRRRLKDQRHEARRLAKEQRRTLKDGRG